MQRTAPLKKCFLLLPALLTATAWAQTPAPGLQTQFNFPLADKTTATAVLLPAPAQAIWMVYATKDGKIGSYLLTSSFPTPPPEPEPQPHPQPPNVLPPLPDWIMPGKPPGDRTCKGRCRWR